MGGIPLHTVFFAHFAHFAHSSMGACARRGQERHLGALWRETPMTMRTRIGPLSQGVFLDSMEGLIPLDIFYIGPTYPIIATHGDGSTPNRIRGQSI